MKTARFLLPLLTAVGPAPALAGQDRPQDALEKGQTTVEELIASLEAREKELASVSMEMSTRSAVPGGMEMETQGRMRVLGKTHFHVSMSFKFGEGMEGEQEVVRTPEGVWTREADAMRGEVFTYMDPELMAKLEKASEVLGREGPPGSVQQRTPLGSAMLRTLSERFDLEVTGKLIKDGFDHLVIKGSLRKGEEQEASDLPNPDMAEVLVRQRPLRVAQMSQFREGKEIMRLEIPDLQIDPDMSPDSFVIRPPEGVKFKDVMDNPVAAEQIEALLEEARLAEEEGKKKERGGQTTSEARKKDGGR